MNPVIAIDGPAASGKSTVARKVAKQLSFIYVDTGAMYRAVTWLALEETIDTASRSAMRDFLENCAFEPCIEDLDFSFRLNGRDPIPHIRSEEVTGHVSEVASIPEVREYLVIRQRQLRNQASLVMEGRDIGTVVFTDTTMKYFLDADPEIRQQRRNKQGETDHVQQRDQKDSTRQTSPLVKAADAIQIDTGKLTADEIADFIVQRFLQSPLASQKFSPVNG